MKAVVAIVGLALALATPAWGAPGETGYVRIEGQKSGKIKGEVKSAKWADALEVLNFGMETASPTDPASGLATGRLQRQPVTMTVRWSQATPVLFNAMVTNDTLTKIVYSAEGPTPQGGAVVTRTITLTNARIVSFQIVDRNGDMDAVDPVVRISFSYQKIELTHLDGGVTAVDQR